MPRILFGPALRILPIGLLALSLQRLVFAEHPVHDVKLQFVLAVVVAAGAVGGPDRGAVVGFVLGLLYDLNGTTPLGMVALAYGLGGMAAGYVHTLEGLQRYAQRQHRGLTSSLEKLPGEWWDQSTCTSLTVEIQRL